MNTKRINFLKDSLKGYWGTVLNIAISSLLVTLIGINWPLIYKIIVDEVFVNQSLEILGFIIILYIVMFFFEKLLQFLWRLSDAVISSEFINRLRMKIYNKFYSIDAKHLNNLSSGEMTDILNRDTKKIYELLISEGVLTFTSFLRFVISIVYIFSFNLKVGLFILILIPMNYYLSNYFRKKFLQFYKTMKREEDNYNQWLYDILSGLRDIKYLSSALHIKRDLMSRLRKICFLDIKQEIKQTHNNNGQQFLSLLSDIISYSIIAYAIILENMSIGDFVAINIYFGWSRYFFQNVISFFINKDKIFISFDRIIDFLDLEEEKTEGKKMRNGNIVFENVSFSYSNHKILKGIDITIEQNQSIAIVGKSGVGKSTISNLLLKLYEKDQGRILIDGININEISTTSIRDKIGIVRQEPSIFNGSIKYNLCLAKPNATDEELWEALSLARAEDFVMELPGKLEEIISKNNNLSAGQLQRLVLARVLLKNPEIIILDEATSNLDIHTEMEFINNLKNIQNKTFIIIAYRVNALKNVDKIYFLEDGRINREGTHEELRENFQPYAQLIIGEVR